MKRARIALRFLLLGGAVLIPSQAQQYVVSTIAGGNPPTTPAPGLSVTIPAPQGIAVDAAGSVYFTGFSSVFKLDQNGVLTRIAGNYRPGYSGDGGPAIDAQLLPNYMYDPQGVAVDGAGNVYIAEELGQRIRRVSPDGVITTVAGTGDAGFSGDGGPATAAQLRDPTALAVDGAGNLFVADGQRVRKVAPSGIITTVAGGGQSDPVDGGPATAASLSGVWALAVDSSGNLFFEEADTIRKVSPSGIITTVTRQVGSQSVGNMALDSAGNLLIEDGNSIRKVSPSGMITPVAGNFVSGFSGDGGPATAAALNFPLGAAVDRAGNLFIADYANRRIRKISVDGIIATVAGNGGRFSYYDGSGDFSGDDGPAANAQLNAPTDVAVDAAGNVFIADLGNRLIRKVAPSGIITTVAGIGTQGYSGDGGPATSAQLGYPLGVAVDNNGNLFIADRGPVRRVSPDGVITTVAGAHPSQGLGDGGPANNAGLSAGPVRVDVDAAGNLFILTGSRIRKVSSEDGVITTVAGNGGGGYSGDGGPATSATLSDGDTGDNCDEWPNSGLAVDGAGNVFLADTYNDRIREVSSSGIITTVAGNGTACYSSPANCPPPGDGGPATDATLSQPRGLALDRAGNLFIAEYGSIRRLSPSGVITTVAGNGACCSSVDGVPATSAALGAPRGLALDSAGNIYFADTANNAVRVLRPTNHSVLIGAVVDAASQRPAPVSPGQIVVIYGAGLGPSSLVQNQASNGQFPDAAGGTTVSFNGIGASVLYASDTQVGAIVPYSITGSTARVTVTFHGATSAAVTVPIAPAAPGLFTANQSGAGQAAAINADGTKNTAANPVKIGGLISLFATGSGQTSPAGVDGKLGGSAPILPVKVTIGGIPAAVSFAGGAPGLVAGVIQVNVQVPSGVQPGGYVPVVLQVGDIPSTPGAVWIAVSGN